MKLSTLAQSEWDFSYLTNHKHLKRCAVLYEYGRQNNTLKQWISYLRKLGMFKTNKDYLLIKQHVRDEINQRINQERDIVSLSEIQLLVSLEAFPAKPFHDALPALDIHLCKHINGGAISKPLPQMREIPDGIWYRKHQSIHVENDPANIEQSVHIFSIPWKDTSNDELATQFRSWLDTHRPTNFSTGRAKGRNSGSSDGANHKLSQLGAYRWHYAGFNRGQALQAGFPYYSSEREWNRAIAEADDRIKRVYPYPV